MVSKENKIQSIVNKGPKGCGKTASLISMLVGMKKEVLLFLSTSTLKMLDTANYSIIKYTEQFIKQIAEISKISEIPSEKHYQMPQNHAVRT